MRKTNYTAKSIKLLDQLTKDHPACTLGQHITLAFGEYSSMDCMSDRSFYETLFDYANSLELMEFCEGEEFEDDDLEIY